VATILRALAGLGLLALAGTGAFQAAWAQTGPGSGTPVPRIAFVDAAGHPLSGPVVRIAGAYPAMEPRSSVVGVRNTGAIAETYRISARVSGSDGRALARVLQVLVTERSTDRVVYRGGLSDLRFEDGTALRPGGSTTYRITIAWPGSEGDERYQGAGLAFSLVGTAEAVGPAT
jgi:hypothetical protein